MLKLKTKNYQIEYNEVYDDDEGFYYVVRDLKTKKAIYACTGYNSQSEALECGQYTVLKYWCANDKDNDKEIINLFSELTNKIYFKETN